MNRFLGITKVRKNYLIAFNEDNNVPWTLVLSIKGENNVRDKE